MPHYLLQTAYTSDAWASLLKKPGNRFEAVQPTIERLGGSIVSGWLAFGDYDVVAIVEMPDNVSVAAFAMAVAAGGGVKAVKTTPLISPTEGLAAMKRAAQAGYKPPGK